MRLSNVAVVYKKELKDLTRDRRTMINMVLFPLVFFPLMSVGIGSFQQKMIRQTVSKSAKVMVLGAANAPDLARMIEAAPGLEVVPPEPDYAQQISDKKLRAALEVPPGFAEALERNAEPPNIKIYLYMAEISSGTAADRLEEVVTKYRQTVVEQKLTARGLKAEFLSPVSWKEENVATAEKLGGSSLGRIIPYFIVFLCLIGAMHPAMDLTAGEKERGTMETILTSPISRGELVLGKFLLVVSASLWSAVLSMISFTFSLTQAKGYAAEMMHGQHYAVSAKALGFVLLSVLPLAVMFAGVLLAICLFAKTFKEAQSYAGYIMIAAILPAIGSMLPGVELNSQLAVVPVLNVALLCRELFSGNYPWGMMALVLGSSFFYAGVALAVTARQFHREEVLFRT